MKRRSIPLILIALITLFSFATPVYAISNPDSEPTIESLTIYRNILETGDFFILIYENTPYATTPTDYSYSEAFIWRLYDTDGTTLLGQNIGCNYNDSGYGYNVIGLYFSAAGAPTWGSSYILRCTGTLVFDTPPSYPFTIDSGDYSALTDSDEVKTAISEKVLEIAADLDIQWAIEDDYSLLSEVEAGTKLSIYGQSFFRQAIYGIQGIAPNAFPYTFVEVNMEDRTWTDNYSIALEGQHSGTIIDSGMTAGNTLLDVNYNLFGILLVLLLVVGLIFAHWRISGGDRWKGMVESVPIIIISARLTLIGLGEVGLIAALSWLFLQAKVWKLI